MSYKLCLILFSFLQTGYGLQCWKCSSEYDVTCKDHFNITRIQENRRFVENMNYGNRQQQPIRNDPHLEHCDDMFTHSYGQKNVCLKRVLMGANGLPIVNRECRLVPVALKSGECPPDLYDRSRNVEFCQTCDYDGCNAATGLKSSFLFASILPLTMAVFLKQ